MDRWIKRATALVVIAVAAFAAIVSYSHIYDLGVVHGQFGAAARLLPLSVDGLILAASLIMLYYARHPDWGKPALGRLMLWSGIGATVAANVLYGVVFGWLAALVSAWPALAFIGCIEMLMLLIRKIASDPVKPDASKPSRDAVIEVMTGVNPDALAIASGMSINAARRELGMPEPNASPDASGRDTRKPPYASKYKDVLAAGKVPPLRQLQDDLHVGQAKAKAIQQRLRSYLEVTKTA